MQPSLFDPEPRPTRSRSIGPLEVPLRVVVLGSGSGGNAVIVECGSDRLLIDAGFSCRELERRLALRGLAARDVAAAFLTHEHEDHCRGIDRFCARSGAPLYLTSGTAEAVTLSDPTRRRTRIVRSGQSYEVAGFVVEPFQIPHDAREPVGLTVEDRWGRRVGLVADLGSRSQLAWARLLDLDLLVIEANHDLDMLRNGPYPWALKQRVAGRHGHLSNADAAEGTVELLSDRLQRVVLYHLSRTNNLPALALAAVAEAIDRAGSRAEVVVSEQDQPTAWLEVP
ncbi:MAG TPA: MBL fold metallo-hydrolase [Thermoanaerobaculia bacterium]|nr:MBL fold metallo-hydrolase [Thermoanaerobaculia bacterium]